MIRIVAHFHLKENKAGDAIKLAQELIDETRKEAGCVQYDLAQSFENPDQLVILEAWETKEALDAHSASEHFARIVPAIAQLCEEPPAIHSYLQII